MIFHIHGEALKPDSVILGHYFYGTLLFSYDNYLTRRAPQQCYRMEGGHLLSWLDYFILGDVYTLGFGFDTAEIDLWWLLCRKKRERARPSFSLVTSDTGRPSGSAAEMGSSSPRR